MGISSQLQWRIRVYCAFVHEVSQVNSLLRLLHVVGTSHMTSPCTGVLVIISDELSGLLTCNCPVGTRRQLGCASSRNHCPVISCKTQERLHTVIVVHAIRMKLLLGRGNRPWRDVALVARTVFRFLSLIPRSAVPGFCSKRHIDKAM